MLSSLFSLIIHICMGPKLSPFIGGIWNLRANVTRYRDFFSLFIK